MLLRDGAYAKKKKTLKLNLFLALYSQQSKVQKCCVFLSFAYTLDGVFFLFCFHSSFFFGLVSKTTHAGKGHQQAKPYALR
eukprot:NODE_21_length_2715_cov_425.371716_g20_i0.p3 GENE.NODE_21_length_2715_cov_425.371716_g20_i0~~NODE_21_length_2715_cov_425.371716_g20_i0.p3  ORF type:complete len:81 (+),score=24.23 NODE_21_length_2715_cov_425.371716_g20_i0:1841-2083(+)